ncbi:Trafficking protein particle complex subunit 13 [Penicillium rolfsii]|nr:Trafficking protein particle complex subunit 13 [Penicillium rolfsii]
MARPRAASGADAPKEPHAVSLKGTQIAPSMTRELSRPSLSYQSPLPAATTKISPKASLSYPSTDFDDQFILTPILTLPPAFGSVYVGETFACTLSANNEISAEETGRVVTSVRIVAEMQTPSSVAALELDPARDTAQSDGLDIGESLQKIVRYDLKEEGNHILAVSVSYTENRIGENAQAASGRVRTFRKLYQFVAQPCLSVRTKASELPPLEVENKSLGPYGKTRLLRFALEAQLENVGDGTVVVKQTRLNPKAPFKCQSLNWDATTSDPSTAAAPPTLNPRDVLQVAFLIEQEEGRAEGLEALQKDLRRDGRATLGQLSIEWRGAMGDKGFLTTGNLMSRKRA